MQNGRRSRAKTYDSDSLMLRSVLGIMLIAIGLISLLSIVGGFQSAIFDMVKTATQGLGGSLCLGLPLFFIWGGALVTFSARRKAPVRAILLVSLLYLCVLGIINLLSKVINVSSFMEYTVAYNNKLTPPSADADGYWQVITAGYQVCSVNGVFGGALGMVTAWPLWTFLGATGGVVILSIISLVCVVFFSKFDFIGVFRRYRDSSEQRLEERELKRQRRLYEKQLNQQTLQAEPEADNAQRPAYQRRRDMKAAQAMQETQAIPQQGFPPGYGGLPVWQQGVPAGAVAQGQQTMFAPAAQASRQPKPELYDEMIVPEMPGPEKPSPLPWKSKARNTRQTARDAEMPVTKETVQPLAANTREANRVLEQMEANRQRKAEIDRRLGQMSGQTTADTAEALAMGNPVLASAGRQPKLTQRQVDYAIQTAAYQPPDPFAAYKKPEVAEAPHTLTNNPAQRPAPKPYAPPKPTPAQPGVKNAPPYPYPMIELLNLQTQTIPDTRDQDRVDAKLLEETLKSFDIPARVQHVTHGPAVTRFELGLISSGINVRRIMGIADNIALEMAANGGVRIEVPIPGTNLFGVEVPNKEIISVSLAEVLTSPEMSSARSPLSVALGKDIAGRPIICDLAKMPHLLIAGQTGSGKSVCINSIINSLLFRASPDEVRMIMIDPKVVELQGYNRVPHLLIPVVSDPHKASGALAWAVQEMLDRYHKMQSKGVREITTYNAKVKGDEPKLPRIVIIIDELSDLMLACKKEVEESIIRLAQLARAAGIHVIVATQRPTVNVITGLIKANIPSRIAFAVASSVDSRTILDMNGAEKLLGRGDMFYYPTGSKAPLRVQGCFVSDLEINNIVDYIGNNSVPDYDQSISEVMESPDADEADGSADDADASEQDDRLQEAVEMVLTDGQASISMLQRRMKIGYARAGRLIDDMAARGIVSKSAGSKPREILISYEQYLRQRDTLLR
jgi:DNA segregation ATPase FtsK/SpoIIIE-like protein